MSVFVPVAMLMASLAAGAGAGAGAGSANRYAAQVKTSILSGNWSWLVALDDRNGVLHKLAEWAAASETFDICAARAQALYRAWYAVYGSSSSSYDTTFFDFLAPPWESRHWKQHVSIAPMFYNGRSNTSVSSSILVNLSENHSFHVLTWDFGEDRALWFFDSSEELLVGGLKSEVFHYFADSIDSEMNDTFSIKEYLTRYDRESEVEQVEARLGTYRDAIVAALRELDLDKAERQVDQMVDWLDELDEGQDELRFYDSVTGARCAVEDLGRFLDDVG